MMARPEGAAGPEDAAGFEGAASGTGVANAAGPGSPHALAEQLSQAALVHIDARVLASHLAATGPPRPTDFVLAGVRERRIKAQTSSLSLYQILAEVYRRGEVRLAREIARGLRLHSHLRLVPVDAEIAVQAAEVRARLGGRPERALQIATALVCDADAYLTTGSGLRRIAGMRVLNVEDFATAEG